MINRKFGKLLVVKQHGTKNNRKLWECLCECGNTSYQTTNGLTTGNTKSCGKCKKIYNYCVICGEPIYIRRRKTCSDICKKKHSIECNKLRIPLVQAIKLTNKTQYKLKEESYISSSKKAVFIDKEYGEFEQIPQKVWYHKAGHPKSKNERLSNTIENLKKKGQWHNRFGKEEKRIRDKLNMYLESNSKTDRNILGGKELDFYNDKLKLAIEYCGLYWHNENSPEPRLREYHNNKRLLCEKKGIRLITIFEDEWIHREKQVLNFLKSVVGYYENKIFARETIFKQINREESKKFLEENHIQSFARLSKYFFGLYHNDTLVSVMTFGKHHRQGQHDLILDRFAVKDTYSIPGAASKLFKNACKYLPKGRIISWSDNRWSQGNVYKKIGFFLEKELPPDYSYVPKKNSNRKRISKQSQQKKKTNCPKDMKEKEWALFRGLSKIWDCGKKRWVFFNK